MSAATSAPTSALTSALTVELAVHLDFQGFLLLSLRLENGGVRWLWLDPCAELTHWQAFRRAVHSSAAGNLRQGGRLIETAAASAAAPVPTEKARA